MGRRFAEGRCVEARYMAYILSGGSEFRNVAAGLIVSRSEADIQRSALLPNRESAWPAGSRKRGRTGALPLPRVQLGRQPALESAQKPFSGIASQQRRVITVRRRSKIFHFQLSTTNQRPNQRFHQMPQLLHQIRGQRQRCSAGLVQQADTRRQPRLPDLHDRRAVP